MLGETFRTVIPWAVAPPGSWDRALLARFWTRAREVSRSVPTSKVMVRVYEPSLELVDDM